MELTHQLWISQQFQLLEQSVQLKICSCHSPICFSIRWDVLSNEIARLSKRVYQYTLNLEIGTNQPLVVEKPVLITTPKQSFDEFITFDPHKTEDCLDDFKSEGDISAFPKSLKHCLLMILPNEQIRTFILLKYIQERTFTSKGRFIQYTASTDN